MTRDPLAQSDWDPAQARRVIAAHSARPGAMLPILHALQDAFGFIHPDAVPLIATALNVTKAEVRGIISFYHDYREAPAGRHVLKICRGEACQSLGVDRLVTHLAVKHGMQLGESTGDGRLTIEPVFCLGNCALAPAALLDQQLIGRFDEARLDAVLRNAPEAMAS